MPTVTFRFFWACLTYAYIIISQSAYTALKIVLTRTKKMKRMKLSLPYFFDLGKDKEYEMRPLKDSKGEPKKQASWDVGLNVCVTPDEGEPNEPYVVQITERHEFPTFRAALETYGYKKFMPNQPNIESAIQAYKSIDNGNYAKAEKIGGVVAWKMVLAKTQQ